MAIARFLVEVAIKLQQELLSQQLHMEAVIVAVWSPCKSATLSHAHSCALFRLGLISAHAQLHVVAAHTLELALCCTVVALIALL
jgi:hypothetical protein